METFIYMAGAALFLLLVLIVLVIILLTKNKQSGDLADILHEEMRLSRKELREDASAAELRQQQAASQDKKALYELQEARLKEVSAALQMQEARFNTFSQLTDRRLADMTSQLNQRMAELKADTNRELSEMRKTVDAELRETLESRISQSFRTVSERLEQVYKGLGEMQGLASGVGDLKKVLTNVKTKGILGELQLGAILGEILSPDQYLTNAVTRPGHAERVEFAIKLPSSDRTVLLPIDSKFPSEPYRVLEEAYEKADPNEIREASQLLINRLRSCAKDIRTKYVEPPHTTDFAILFLPFEGLYAEAVRLGMVETLQHEFKINIAGPSTMAALLNSLQLGFRSLAIQKRSAQVWDVLISVKDEFDKFGDALAMTDQRLTQAQNELDKLVGVRTRQIQRKLDKLTAPDDLQESAASEIQA